jgi:hypothetical protein
MYLAITYVQEGSDEFDFFFLGGGVSNPLCLSSSLALHFSDYSFWSTTLLTGKTGISLHMQWPLTSQSDEFDIFGYFFQHLGILQLAIRHGYVAPFKIVSKYLLVIHTMWHAEVVVNFYRRYLAHARAVDWKHFFLKKRDYTHCEFFLMFNVLMFKVSKLLLNRVKQGFSGVL